MSKIIPCDRCLADANRGAPAYQREDDRAERYRIAQAAHLIHMFTEVHGREPASIEELNDWAELAQRSRDAEPR